MMSGDTQREPARAERRGRGRPRREGADEQIIEAALAEYGELGYAGFTIDRVAKRAGVGKSTIYLRGPDKESLLAAAMRANDATLALPPDTGSLRGDLYELTLVLLRRFREPVGWASYRVFFDAAMAENRSNILPPDVRDDYLARGQQIFDRAEARGDLVFQAAPITLMSVLHGAAIHQLLALHVDAIELTDTILDRVAHNITSLLVDRR